MLIYTKASLPTIVCIALVSFHTAVLSQTNLTLHDALTAAVERQSIMSEDNLGNNSTENSFLSWIDGSPSVSLSRLESQESLGTTESELSLNLPLKTPFLKEMEENFLHKVKALREHTEKRYTLYLSGLIRNVLWDIEIEKVALKTLRRKQAVMSELSEQFSEMTKVQAIPQYLSLILQNELNQQKVSFSQHQQNIKTLKDRYFHITGLYILPNDIAEEAPKFELGGMNLHPDMQILNAVFNSTKQQLLSASKKATPWNIQLTGKRLETQGVSETQLGIGIEVPISVGSNLSTAQQSELSKITTEHTIAKQKLILELTGVQNRLKQEYEFLIQKQILLNDGLTTLNSLVEAMNELRAANAPNQEFYIRTLLNAFDSQQDADLNLVHIQRHIALIKQASGITL